MEDLDRLEDFDRNVARVVGELRRDGLDGPAEQQSTRAERRSAARVREDLHELVRLGCVFEHRSDVSLAIVSGGEEPAPAVGFEHGPV